jgi:subtilase family serine protease
MLKHVPLLSLFSVLVAIAGYCQSADAKIIEAALNLKHRVSMGQLAANVLDPSSPRYRRFYTPDEIRGLAAPSAQAYQGILNQITAAGFTVIHQSKAGLRIVIRGDSSTFDRVFGSHIIPASANGALYRSDRQELIPATMPWLSSVSGLSNTARRRPEYSVVNSARFSASPTGVSPAQVHAIYGMNPLYSAGITGKGQHIAIATYDNFDINDVRQYFQSQNLPVPTIDAVNFNGVPNVNQDSAVETQADAEFSGMIAPDAQIHVFASSHNDEAGELEMYTAILDDNRAKVVNYSWGGCETSVSPAHRAEMDSVFARAVAQGVNIFVASGDNGSADCLNSKKSVTDFPSSSPLVIAVGGTALQGYQTGQPTEIAWSHSGGGVSSIYKQAAWETIRTPNGMRGVPDVALNADPQISGEAVFAHNPTTNTAGFLTIGGTSIAAPQWAGFLALVGQARNGNNIGFIAPIIYGASDQTKSAVLNDVTTGSNGAFHAVAGWDPVTGFGSMHGDAMLKFFAAH